MTDAPDEKLIVVDAALLEEMNKKFMGTLLIDQLKKLTPAELKAWRRKARAALRRAGR